MQGKIFLSKLYLVYISYILVFCSSLICSVAYQLCDIGEKYKLGQNPLYNLENVKEVSNRGKTTTSAEEMRE